MIRILLTMIVKNESRILARCLDSAFQVADAALICDTGSTDDTWEVARNGAPRCRIVHVPWKNFGHNRTIAASHARAYAKDLDWSPRETYLLFLDADMVLHVEPGFDLQALTEPHYELLQKEGSLAYRNTRLARLDHEWECVGPTHEFWRPTPDVPPSTLDSLWIEDRGDGGSKGDKHQRDIRLLSDALLEEPNNERYWFYLAESYRYSGQFGRAHDAYSQRHARGGWDEERWYAKYQQGRCLLEMKEHERGAGVLLDAWEERPSRAEPLVALARDLRLRGKNRQAFLFATEAKHMKRPDDRLFVEEDAYGWAVDQELSISAFYMNKKNVGAKSCERLLASREAPDDVRDLASRNLLFYVSELPHLKRGQFKVPEELRTFGGTVYHPSTPTVASDGKCYTIVVRLVNYDQERGRWYTSRDADGIIRTENVTACMHATWKPDAGAPEFEFLNLVPPWPETGSRIEGLEDIRITPSGYLTATCAEVPGYPMPQVVTGHLSGFASIELPPYEKRREVEKNWLPWEYEEGKLWLIYSWDPFIVLDTQGREVVNVPAPCNASRWRGSAAPIRWDHDTWIAMVHEVVRRENDNVYLHRFVEIGLFGGVPQILRHSKAFTLEHLGIEYVGGICELGQEGCLITYSVEDRAAKWMVVDYDTVEEMLLP